MDMIETSCFLGILYSFWGEFVFRHDVLYLLVRGSNVGTQRERSHAMMYFLLMISFDVRVSRRAHGQGPRPIFRAPSATTDV